MYKRHSFNHFDNTIWDIGFLYNTVILSKLVSTLTVIILNYLILTTFHKRLVNKIVLFTK